MKGQRGSALLEIIVAVSMFALCVLGLSNSVLAARKTGDSSRQASEAATLAYDKLEHLRALPLTSAELSAGAHTDAQNRLRSDGATGGIYTRSWLVTRNSPRVGLRSVQMTVTWPNRGGNGSVSLVTFMTQ